MKKITYYIASSVDGYISGPEDDVSGFTYGGNAVERYLEDLKSFEVVIMGRSTYEFGYKFGVQPGEPSPAYSHMQHYVFSDNLSFDNASDQVEVKKLDLEEIDRIKRNSKTDIYLCGGGKFAGWLLQQKKVDFLKIKLNPVVLNQGIKLFEGVETSCRLNMLESEVFDNGVQIITYEIEYLQVEN